MAPSNIGMECTDTFPKKCLQGGLSLFTNYGNSCVLPLELSQKQVFSGQLSKLQTHCLGLFNRLGMHLRRDTLASFQYSEELNSITISATSQRTKRHGILGQKPADFQRAS